MSIPSSFIDQLIDQADIVEVVGRRLQLNKKGSNFCLINKLINKTARN